MTLPTPDAASLAAVASRRVKICVTDHALVRFIEREKGISLDQFRREIEASTLAAAHLGAHVVKIGSTELVLVKNYDDQVSVVTALPKAKSNSGGKSKSMSAAEARRHRAREDRRFSKKGR